jgi:hypothetical protein
MLPTSPSRRWIANLKSPPITLSTQNPRRRLSTEQRTLLHSGPLYSPDVQVMNYRGPQEPFVHLIRAEYISGYVLIAPTIFSGPPKYDVMAVWADMNNLLVLKSLKPGTPMRWCIGALYDVDRLRRRWAVALTRHLGDKLSTPLAGRQNSGPLGGVE